MIEFLMITCLVCFLLSLADVNWPAGIAAALLAIVIVIYWVVNLIFWEAM